MGSKAWVTGWGKIQKTRNKKLDVKGKVNTRLTIFFVYTNLALLFYIVNLSTFGWVVGSGWGQNPQKKTKKHAFKMHFRPF